MTWKMLSQEALLPGIVCSSYLSTSTCPTGKLSSPFVSKDRGGKVTQHVPHQKKFWITSPMLPCQIWANTTFKSPNNPRNQLLMIPLWFFLDICPTIMFQPSSQWGSLRIPLLPFLSRTPNQYSKHYRFNCTARPALYPPKERHRFPREQIPGVRGCWPLSSVSTREDLLNARQSLNCPQC